MAPPTKTITNVLVGSAFMYLADEGTEAPADTVAYGEDWGGDWYHPGYSDDGLDFMFDRKEKKHRVDELSSPVVITVDETTMKIGFKFAEATLENLMYAAGGGDITTIAAGSGQIGKKTLKISENLDVVTIGFDGKNPQGFFRRVVIPRVTAVGKMKTQYDRSKNKQVYAAEFESVCSIEDILIYDKTANATV